MPSAPPRRAVSAILTATALALTTAACQSGSDTGSGAGSADGSIVTSFYPIQFATQQITSGRLPVTVLTKPGAEPHDLELAPQDIGGMTKARLVVYADGFQPAVDEAVGLVDAAKVLDVADVARLMPASTDDSDHADESGTETDPNGPSEAGDGHDGHDHGADDPHFWLDPSRYAAVAQAISARLSADDPENAATYAKNTAVFVEKLSELDDEMRTGLRQCTVKELVTSHAAFGYLAARYGFHQRGITGVSPEAEPSAAALKAVGDLVRSAGVTTIYQETLVEPHFAQTVAESTGAKVATLDPIEGITSASVGTDYFEVMRSNLVALRDGQECS
ncbi:metal ABC transporter substrate-binding protein [Terrabacter sp. Ter38]|uniref:metal ABC transporter substrate-binding protein n=1 Tax=Terrabacter sp. Ter38 TaxID=2926030 RepID=UPI0021178BA1|nr:metal ABC transporter substrate-binding protein [Terrabacter sp. Ter38]